jgi:hypothetical protein
MRALEASKVGGAAPPATGAAALHFWGSWVGGAAALRRLGAWGWGCGAAVGWSSWPLMSTTHANLLNHTY